MRRAGPKVGWWDRYPRYPQPRPRVPSPASADCNVADAACSRCRGRRHRASSAERIATTGRQRKGPRRPSVRRREAADRVVTSERSEGPGARRGCRGSPRGHRRPRPSPMRRRARRWSPVSRAASWPPAGQERVARETHLGRQARRREPAGRRGGGETAVARVAHPRWKGSSLRVCMAKILRCEVARRHGDQHVSHSRQGPIPALPGGPAPSARRQIAIARAGAKTDWWGGNRAASGASTRCGVTRERCDRAAIV